jgi:hypothetical protein
MFLMMRSTSSSTFAGLTRLALFALAAPCAFCYRPLAAILPYCYPKCHSSNVILFATRCWLITTRILLSAFGHHFAIWPFCYIKYYLPPPRTLLSAFGRHFSMSNATTG